MPEHYEGNWLQWERLYPGWKFVTWHEAELERFGMPSVYYSAPTFAEKSDLARYEVAFRLGGIYTDCDVLPLSRFDCLFAPGTEVVVFAEQPGLVCNGLFAASARTTVLRLAATPRSEERPESTHRRGPERADWAVRVLCSALVCTVHQPGGDLGLPAVLSRHGSRRDSPCGR